MERPNAWNAYDEAALTALHGVGERYKKYLNAGKTERECVDITVEMVKAQGYVDLKEVIEKGGEIKPGDKLYVTCMGRAIALFYIGKAPLAKGMNIVGSHIDSPRIDLKQNPFYQESDFAYADTHYYGGIKKYHWVARPLSLHGVVVKKDGTVIKLAIGEDENDPVVGISELLIHLSAEQMAKKASEVVKGEDLDIIMAGRPLKGVEKDGVKAALLKLLEEKYGIEEEDMVSAEIEAVPAEKARDFGLDRSMIMGYGHDDRVCAYASLEALLNLKETPDYTCCCLMVDKEEVGSVGATGMHGRFFENTVAELIALTGNYSDLTLRRTLANSRMLSCDVSAGYDPLYFRAFEEKNAAVLGRGVCFNKYTGSKGKSGSNDANPEFIAQLRGIMDKGNVSWQTAELGGVDVGGGGTIAYICGNYGMQVIDSGVAVLSMHAPAEVISKADLYEAVKAYEAFMKYAD